MKTSPFSVFFFNFKWFLPPDPPSPPSPLLPLLLVPMSIVLPTYHIRPDGENARFSETKARLIAKESLESELKGKGAEKWENHNFEVRSP
jgi:hypothetical protein